MTITIEQKGANEEMRILADGSPLNSDLSIGSLVKTISMLNLSLKRALKIVNELNKSIGL